MLSSVTSFADISFPDVQQVYYTTLSIESTQQKELTLPFNGQLATIPPFTTHHEETFQGAARHTTERLADTWKVYILDPQTSDNLTSLTASTYSQYMYSQSITTDLEPRNSESRNDTSAQVSHGEGSDYFWMKTAIFPVSVSLLLFSMKFGTELKNYQYDSFK